MADANTNAAQTNTDAAQGNGNQAGAGTSLMTSAPAGDAGQGGAQANSADSNNQAGNAGDSNGNNQAANADGKPAGAPEKYDLKVPDGMTIDEAALAEFDPIARELNLSNEQAQKLADIYSKRMAESSRQQQEQWKQTTEKWVDDVKADKELGGQNLETSIKHAQAALNKFGTPELRSQMDATGMGNHPELVRVFARIGKAMAEDTFVQSGKDGAQVDPAKKLFPSMN